MDENKKKLEQLKQEYDDVTSKIKKLLKKDDSKTLAEYQQKMTPLLSEKDRIVKELDQMYKVLKTDFEAQRRQLKAREAEIKKQAQAQKRRKR